MLERGDQCDLLLVALRVLPELPARVEVEAFDEVALVGPIDPAAQVPEVLDGLGARQPVVQSELARQVPDPTVDLDRAPEAVEAEDAGRPRTRPDQVEEQADRRRLAGAVRAEEPEDLALLDLEIDVDDPAMTAVMPLLSRAGWPLRASGSRPRGATLRGRCDHTGR